jgi:MFS family permease
MSSSDPYAAIRIRDFRLFVTSRLFITLAMQMQGVIVGWQIYELTKDPLALGLIGLAEAIPAITVSLYAGHLADVVERKKIIVTCVSVLAACSAALL